MAVFTNMSKSVHIYQLSYCYQLKDMSAKKKKHMIRTDVDNKIDNKVVLFDNGRDDSSKK